MSSASLSARLAVSIGLGLLGIVFALIGLLAFNLGYIGIYGAFFPLLGLGALLFVEVGEDFFFSLLLLVASSTFVYVVGLFALPVVAISLGGSVFLMFVLQRLGMMASPKTVVEDPHPGWRTLELSALLLVSLFARYVIYRSGGGHIPLNTGEFESLVLFVLSEVGGWIVFGVGYGLQHKMRYGVLYSPDIDFASSLPSLLITGVFLVTPYVAIMALGLQTVGIAGLYLGSLPAGAAHMFMRTLTLRRTEIERQNIQLHNMTRDLLRNERMVAVGQMSSTISHQILQKVGLIGLQCDVLRESFEDPSLPAEDCFRDVHEQLGQLDAAITDLNTTLSDLLIFSRDFALHREMYSLDLLLREVAQEVQTVAQAKREKIVYHCDGESGPVSLDRIKMKQALLNVLTNAVEASPANGEVRIDLQLGEAGVRLTITDEGDGIAEGDRERIFSPFYSTKETGSGLGLPFAQKIIELHGGHIQAVNNPERGATFVIEIPLESIGI